MKCDGRSLMPRGGITIRSGRTIGPTGEARRLQLPDGRRLCYAEYGTPEGRPLLFFHGTPGARLMARFAHPAAARHGIRIVAPERPGYGLSDAQPGRRIDDWPEDVVALADSLGLERFAIAGVSGGAPYVAACAHRLPERVRVAGIVSGVGPFDDPEVAAAFSAAQRRALAVGCSAAWAVRPLAALPAGLVRRFPLQAIDLIAPLEPAADQALLARPEIRAALADDLRQALRQGVGAVLDDLLLFGQPWGFRLEDITVPVELWHGERDAQVPVAVGRRVARRLAACRARFIPDAAHLWLFDHCEEVLTTLCPP
jgi:pimeloyl-ACP methyl ester carboxylesterase